MCRGMGEAIGPSPRFQIFTGPEPESLETPSTGVMLAQWALSSDWYRVGPDGSITMVGVPLTSASIAAGKAGYYRIMDNTGVECHEQGTVWMKGDDTPPEHRDLEIDNTNVAEGQAIQVKEFVQVAPGA